MFMAYFFLTMKNIKIIKARALIITPTHGMGMQFWYIAQSNPYI